MERIDLHNISISYDKQVINNLSFSVQKNKSMSIIGPIGSGKSTICKILSGKLKYEGTISINGVEICNENKYLLERYIRVVDNNILNSHTNLINELFDGLDGLNLSFEEETKRVNEIIEFFKLNKYLEKRISSFDVEYKNYFKIIKELIKYSEYIVIDDLFINMKKDMIDNIVKFCNMNKITLINITSDIENVLYTDYLVVLYMGSIAMEGNTIECLKEEKLMRRLGLNLPFLVDLSIQLGYYGLLDKVILDEGKMIDKIWK